MLASQNIPAGAGGKAPAAGKRQMLPSSDTAAAAHLHPAHPLPELRARESELGRATCQVPALCTDRQLLTDEQPLIPNTPCAVIHLLSLSSAKQPQLPNKALAQVCRTALHPKQGTQHVQGREVVCECWYTWKLKFRLQHLILTAPPWEVCVPMPSKLLLSLSLCLLTLQPALE